MVINCIFYLCISVSVLYAISNKSYYNTEKEEDKNQRKSHLDSFCKIHLSERRSIKSVRTVKSVKYELYAHLSEPGHSSSRDSVISPVSRYFQYLERPGSLNTESRQDVRSTEIEKALPCLERENPEYRLQSTA